MKAKTEKLKNATVMARELSEGYAELAQSLRDASRSAGSTKKLWRSKNQSKLIKVGLAIIAFPDPTISDVVGGLLVAAGMVQAGIRRRTMYVEDVGKTFQNTLRDIRSLRSEL
jgi:hypothetical protein